jgi:hypothetical protein
MTMKKNDDHPYFYISSFEDFHYEKERLIFKGKLIDTRLFLTYLHIKQVFSASNLLLSLTKEYLLPTISSYIGDLSKKVDNEASS